MKTLVKASGKAIAFLYPYAGIITGAVLLGTSLALLYFTKDIRIVTTGQTSLDTAAFMPRVIFSVLALLSLLHIADGICHVKQKRSTCPAGEALERTSIKALRSFGAFLMMAVYLVLVPRLGFVISALLYLVCMMTFMTKKDARNPAAFVAISVVAVTVVYICFKKYLYINLPVGVMKGVL